MLTHDGVTVLPSQVFQWTILIQELLDSDRYQLKLMAGLELAIIMHPGQPSEARLGGVHFIFRHIQI